MLVEEHRVVVVPGPVQAVFGQVGGQHRRRVGHQRDVAGLAALPGQGGHGGVFQADVADGEVGEFLNPGGGVVEGGEQGRVAAARAGGPVGLGEQAAGLLDGQVVHVRVVVFLGGDREDVLVAGHPGRVLGLHPRAERTDRGQALVARRRAVAPAGSSQSRNPVMAAASTQSRVSLLGRDGSLVAEVADQEFERVAVGRDRVRSNSRAARPGRPVRKRRRKTAKSVAMARPCGDGRDDVAGGLLDAGGDVRVGLGGQPQVVGGVAQRRMAHIRLQHRQQRADVLALRRTRTADC